MKKSLATLPPCHVIFDLLDPWPRFDVKRLIGRRFKDSTVQKASGFGEKPIYRHVFMYSLFDF